MSGEGEGADAGGMLSFLFLGAVEQALIGKQKMIQPVGKPPEVQE
jgi:hypothetical protein